MNVNANPARWDEEKLLTIDELSRRVGMTVRNLREWRTLGLLPPAEVRGRVGYYSADVVRRIEGVRALHDEGFPLELIRRLLDVSGSSGEEVVRFARDLRAPFRDDRPPVVDLEEWERMWGRPRKADLKRARALGLVREREDGTLEYTSARVADVGRALHALGLTIEHVLDATAAVREHADALAELFEDVWLERIWQPFLDAGRPESELPRLQETGRAVQRVAMDAVVALFTVAMEDRIAHGIAREVARAERG